MGKVIKEKKRTQSGINSGLTASERALQTKQTAARRSWRLDQIRHLLGLTIDKFAALIDEKTCTSARYGRSDNCLPVYKTFWICYKIFHRYKLYVSPLWLLGFGEDKLEPITVDDNNYKSLIEKLILEVPVLNEIETDSDLDDIIEQTISELSYKLDLSYFLLIERFLETFKYSIITMIKNNLMFEPYTKGTIVGARLINYKDISRYGTGEVYVVGEKLDSLEVVKLSIIEGDKLVKITDRDGTVEILDKNPPIIGLVVFTVKPITN